jgi:type II secretory pathway pseudopilin PulG
MHGFRTGSPRAQAGLSLIELVAFIVVSAILAVGVFAGLSGSLRGTGEPRQLTQAMQLAQERMDLILGRRAVAGFAAFVDPCPGAAVCTPLPGYSVASTIVTGWLDPLTGLVDPNYKVITANVTGLESTTLTALVSNH